MGIEGVVKEYEQLVSSINSVCSSAKSALVSSPRTCSVRVSYLRDNGIIRSAELRVDYRNGANRQAIKSRLQPYRTKVSDLSARLSDCYSEISSAVESHCVVSRFGRTTGSPYTFVFSYRHKKLGIIVNEGVISEAVELSNFSFLPSGRIYYVNCRNPFIPLDFYVNFVVAKVQNRHLVNENV